MLKCLRFPGLVVACSLHRFPSGNLATSAVVNWKFRLRLSWRISLVTLTPQRTFLKAFGKSLFASLAFSFLPLSWRGHRTVFALDGQRKREFVDELPTAYSFRCWLAYYVLLKSKLFQIYLTILRSIWQTRLSPSGIFRRSIGQSYPVLAGSACSFSRAYWKKLKNLRCSTWKGCWWRSVAVEKSSESEPFLVVGVLFALSWRCSSAGSLSLWSSATSCEWSGLFFCFFRLLFWCRRRSWLEFCGLTCVGRAVETHRLGDEDHQSIRGVSSFRCCCSLVYGWRI